jgi:predicted DNA binding protein
MLKIKKERLYNSEYRRNLSEKISIINDDKLYFKLFNELKNQKDFNYSRNKNGIFFDINKLSDETIIIIKNFMDNNDIQSVKYLNSETEKLEFIQYSTEEFSKLNEKGNRLNNIEKNLLRIYKNK